MYTIIAATNRPNSQTLKVAENYKTLLAAQGIEAQVFSLEELNGDIIHPEMYEKSVGIMKSLQDKYLVPTTKFVFVCPEYNGGVPGVLKLLIDASDIPECWYGKKACLVGVAAGRAGNLRGLDHLTNMLNHFRVTVLPNKLPLSSIDRELDETGTLINPMTIKVLNQQIELFKSF